MPIAILVANFATNASGAIWWPCKKCHLVAKIGTNASVVTWWSNFELIQVENIQLAKFRTNASGILFSWRDKGTSINHVITFGGLPPLPFVIFISLFMLCNGILKRRAGTAPILLHDTLCIFDRKVGTPFPPYGEALIFLKTIFRGDRKIFIRKNCDFSA